MVQAQITVAGIVYRSKILAEFFQTDVNGGISFGFNLSLILSPHKGKDVQVFPLLRGASKVGGGAFSPFKGRCPARRRDREVVFFGIWYLIFGIYVKSSMPRFPSRNYAVKCVASPRRRPGQYQTEYPRQANALGIRLAKKEQTLLWLSSFLRAAPTATPPMANPSKPKAAISLADFSLKSANEAPCTIPQSFCPGLWDRHLLL